MSGLLFPSTVEPLAVSACQVCGWVTLEGLELCIACLDIREWSRVNRGFCDILHRGRALPFRPGRLAWEEESLEDEASDSTRPAAATPRRHLVPEPLGAVA